MSQETTFRSLPAIDTDEGWFWTAGAEGQLKLQRCQACGHYNHPPVPICPKCLGRELAPEPVSGRGTLFSYAVNHQVADQRVVTPYVIGLVSIEEQPELRLSTNIVNCAPEDLVVDMPVRVVFEQHGDTYVPVWEAAR